MKPTTDIRLPKAIEPIFPKRCVLSGEPDPDGTVSIIANRYLLWSAGILALVHGWTRVRAPICRRHKIEFYLRAFGREILLAVGVGIGVLGMMALVSTLGGAAYRRAAGTVGGLLGCIPAIWFANSHPPRFDVEIGPDWICYKFSSSDYAEEFAKLNQPHVIRDENRQPL
jgi:hypothetical protein